MRRMIFVLLAVISVFWLHKFAPKQQASSTPSWIQLSPTGTSPQARSGAASAYDEANDRLIIFSGEVQGVTQPKLNDVWVLTNASAANGVPAWVKLAPTGTAPTGRIFSTAVYDPVANRLIVHGGCASNCAPALSDTWVLTNANGLGGQSAWIQLPGATVIRDSHTAVYDPTTKRMTIFGGSQGFYGTNRNDVWVLKDANGIGTPAWEQLSPTGTPPAPRDGAAAIYDRVTNRMILFGGTLGASSTNFTNYNDTWVLTNANGASGTPQWIQLNPIGTLPAVRSGHSLIYDAATNRALLFGGRTVPNTGSDPTFNDVWVLTAANGLSGQAAWSQRTIAGQLPLPRLLHSPAYAPSSNRMVVSMGSNNNLTPSVLLGDVWLLAGAFQATARTVCGGNVSASPGSPVTVPIEIISQGDENALGFSITFDTNILGNPQVVLGADAVGASLNLNTSQIAQGKLGIAVALPATQKFSAGTRQFANVTFTIAANAQATTTPIGFGDQPIAREIVSDTASVLSASYILGSVTVTPGYEADVSPRPNGNNNGMVTIADWVQTGRFAAGVDTVAVGSEFQRADCAPKATLGDGKIGITDWVQAGRYAAGVDLVVAAGGPTAPGSGLFLANNIETSTSEQQTARAVRTVSANIERGQNGTLTLELDAQGNENALGFSLSFDPAQLRFVSAIAGNGATGMTLNVNTNDAANGRIGIALALSTGQAFAAGTRQLMVVTFTALSSGNGATTAITLGDQPVSREIVDAAANSLTANWAAATVTLARSVASVSAASFNGEMLAADAIVAAFGSGLATSVQIANTLPLPTSLVGTSVKVKDSAGVERLASLFFVAPTQINYLVPANTAAGDAAVTITSGDGAVSVGRVRIANVAPGLFSANSSGQGVAAGEVLRVKANGTQVYESLSRYDASQQRSVPIPIDLGPEGDQVFLILYGTGWRNRSALASVTTKLGGTSGETFYAGPQGSFAGLDQLNVLIPRSLAGRGEVDVVLMVDGVPANIVRVSIK